MVFKAAQAHFGNEKVAALFLLRRAHAALAQAETDVLLHRQPRKERVALEHHAPVRAGAAHGRAFQQRLAFGGKVQPRNDAQQGGFAAAGRAEDGDEVVFAHLQVDGAQRLRGRLAACAGKNARDALHVQLNGGGGGERWRARQRLLWRIRGSYRGGRHGGHRADQGGHAVFKSLAWRGKARRAKAGNKRYGKRGGGVPCTQLVGRVKGEAACGYFASLFIAICPSGNCAKRHFRPLNLLFFLKHSGEWSRNLLAGGAQAALGTRPKPACAREKRGPGALPFRQSLRGHKALAPCGPSRSALSPLAAMR